MDTTTIAANDRNEGLFQRRALAVGSREFDMMGRLHADLLVVVVYLTSLQSEA